MTEEDPPYNFSGQNGQAEGFAVDLVREIQRRTGNSNEILILPWARAYNTTLNAPNCVLFTMARTVEREPLFHWIGPILENSWVIIGRANQRPRLESLNDARTLSAIGVVREFASALFLESQNFTNLEPTTRNTQNVDKLRTGRIEAYVSSNHTWQSEIRSMGLDPSQFRVLLSFHTIDLYIAFSKQTNPALAARWQQALNAMRADGSYRIIEETWFSTRPN